MSNTITVSHTQYESGFNRGYADVMARVEFSAEHRIAADAGEPWAQGYCDGYADACAALPVDEFLTMLIGIPLEYCPFLCKGARQ